MLNSKLCTLFHHLQFGYADLQKLPLSDRFIVTDDAFVQYADVKTTDKI